MKMQTKPGEVNAGKKVKEIVIAEWH